MPERAFLLVTIALAALAPQMASACSWSYEDGYSPNDIKERTDVVRVRGTYRVEGIDGTPTGGVSEDGQPLYNDGVLLGQIERGTGRWPTFIHLLPEWAHDCGMGWNRPWTDATGTFWLERDRARHRWWIIWWEGEYLPAPEQPPLPPTAAESPDGAAR